MKVIGVYTLIVGVALSAIGFYKMLFYENPEDKWGIHQDEKRNAYVGGDAYNYIINGTYFAGYEAIGGSLILLGGVLISAGYICENLEEMEKSNNKRKESEITKTEG